ncbi:MAG TPA: sulfurtransferase TusA family protein [Rhizomicrobium sp.]|jgi:tRNA 2-thiouridine synthesizing protein A|nr:sulfurtransferase TusA family protein [Rhizomicrobium sp.]
MDDDVLDLTGLKCPLPALMARRTLARLAPGTCITILTSDPLAVVDIPHMCGEEGHTVESVTREESRSVFRIRRKRGA